MPINFAIKLVATVALEAAQIGLQATKRTMGPRLDELTITVADYGTPVPRFLGVRRFACPIFHAEDLKEVKNTTKVKGGGKQTTFSYLATFAAAISDNPIDKVLKIWFDDKLVYDVTGTGPSSILSTIVSSLGDGGDSQSLQISKYMRVYTGTEDQLPDPRYVAWCEDKYGPDSAPAYRGVSYMFFEELPVDNFGNRIPQISVLAASATSPTYPYETRTTTLTLFDCAFSAAGTFMLLRNGSGDCELWDLPTRTLIQSGPAPVSIGGKPGIASEGTVWSVRAGGSWIDHWTAEGILIESIAPGFFGAIDVWVIDDAVLIVGTLSTNVYYVTGGVVSIAVPFTVRHYITDGDNTWAIGNSGTTIGFYCVFGPRAGTLQTLTSPTGSSAALAACNPGDGKFVCVQGSGWYLIDDQAWTASTPVTISTSGAGDALDRVRPGDTYTWIGWQKIAFAGPSLEETINPLDWASGSTDRPQYVAVLDAIVADDAGTPLMFRYLNRKASDGVQLSTIINAMCDAAALEDRDTSALTQLVQGYSWTRGDVKSQMEPLLDIHDVDARPHDFEVQFLRRGSAASGTLLTEDFVRAENDLRYKVTVAQDTDLPRMLRVNFADVDFDQQTNNVLSPLTLDEVDTQRDVTIDLTTYAADKDEAQQLSDRYIRRQWNSRERVENVLTPQHLAFEPGDVTALNLDGIVQKARLEKQVLAGGRIECTFIRDEPILATLNSAEGAALDAREPQTITVPAPVRGFVLDVPLMDDADADVRPLLYDGAGTYAGLTYPGTVIFEATGVGTSLAYDTLFDTVADGATWGVCQSTLADVPSPWLWDRGNELTVSLQSGSLTSATEADIDADPELNLILVGQQGAWEYVNFVTATLNIDGTYTLSDLKRGRRGTEWACSGHTGGEAWVLASSLKARELGLDDLGASLSFKAQSIGRSLDSAWTIDVDPYTAATLKPYAPAQINWATDGTDLFGEIIRRTRIGGAWVGGTTIPLSENSEGYEVDIYNGSTFKRTISVSDTNLFTYTGAEITADGNSVSTPPPVNIYQMSDAVGRGFALAA